MKLFASLIAIVLLSLGAEVSAQTEEALRQYFEGRQAVLRIDMPGTHRGVNVYPERPVPMNFNEYNSRLRDNGTAISVGDRVMITKIKLNGRHIEFQLAGGGYGVFGQLTNPQVNPRLVPRSAHEQRLEQELSRETDDRRRRRLREELDEVRRDRERQERRNRAEAERQTEINRERIAEQRLRGGSRFNIHFERRPVSELTPEVIMEALREYVDFSGEAENTNNR